MTTNRKTLFLDISIKTKRLFKFYSILCLGYIILLLLLSVLKHFYPHLFENSYEQKFLKEMLASSPLRLFILATLLAPIIEEMMFRTLIKPSHNDLILLCCSWPIFFVNKIIPQNVHWIIQLVFISICSITVFYILKELVPQEKTKKLRQWLHKYPIPILIFSALIFGLVHITNYVDVFTLNIALLALIAPRIMAGFMMGYIKIRNRHIIWSIALHALNNGVVITILILSQMLRS